jgi:hypothetical protein
MHISSVPIFFLILLYLWHFVIKMWLLLQMYFQFPVSGKIFLYSVIIFSTFWSIAPINCHAVVPYQITNIYTLLPITVMVLLCVNTSATVCDYLCLLGCSQDWTAVVVCLDARRPFWHVPPLATFDTCLITNSAKTIYVFYFFVYCNFTTREQAKF